jgi:hypothetical protein
VSCVRSVIVEAGVYPACASVTILPSFFFFLFLHVCVPATVHLDYRPDFGGALQYRVSARKRRSPRLSTAPSRFLTQVSDPGLSTNWPRFSRFGANRAIGVGPSNGDRTRIARTQQPGQHRAGCPAAPTAAQRQAAATAADNSRQQPRRDSGARTTQHCLQRSSRAWPCEERQPMLRAGQRGAGQHAG